MAEREPLPTTRADLYDSFRHTTIPDNYVVITGPGGLHLAKPVSDLLGVDITNPIGVYEDSGQIFARIKPNCRKQTVFAMESTAKSSFGSPNDHLVGLKAMVNGAKGGDAQEVRAIAPYMAYAREDRKTAPRMPIMISLVAREIIAAGAQKIFTMDIHSPQALGMIPETWDDVSGLTVLLPYLKELGAEAVVLSPDSGGQSRAERVAALLDGGHHDIAFIYKRRDPNHAERSEAKVLVGDVKGRPVLMYDDIAGTGQTLLHGAALAKEAQATEVYAAVTHGLFAKDPDSGKTLPEIMLEPDCPITKLIVTNTIDQTQREDVRKAVEAKKMIVACVGPVIAKSILCVLTGESISNTLIVNR